MKVLICDDQPMIHETLSEYLEAEGFERLSAYDGQEALEIFGRERPDFVILDLMMPKINGMDVCRRLRKESDTPIIMLTAKGEEIDKILGLELGADDYIVKPFSPREVVARVKVILRRVKPRAWDDAMQRSHMSADNAAGMRADKVADRGADNGAAETSDGQGGATVAFPGLSVSIRGYNVIADGRALQCTPKEVELLYKLCSSPGRVYTREQLLADVWGYDYYGDTRVVDTQIKRIRQKLGDDERWAIRSVYGVGYKFEVT